LIEDCSHRVRKSLEPKLLLDGDRAIPCCQNQRQGKIPSPHSASAVYSPTYREAQSILKAWAPGARSPYSKPKVNQRSRSPSSCKGPSPASLVSVRVALHWGRTQQKCPNILRTDSQFIRWGEAECDLGPKFIRTIPEERRCLGHHLTGVCELHRASFRDCHGKRLMRLTPPRRCRSGHSPCAGYRCR
jgi:hypothetical protein